MDQKIKELLIAILFGWCGGYRFYKKQYILGILYFLTFGLFCIGWLVDIIQVCEPTKNNNSAATLNISSSVVDEFYTKVVGVTFPCALGGFSTRQDAILNMRKKDKLKLEYFEYEGDPAYRVVISRNHTDIGNLKADLAKEIYRKYKDCNIEIVEHSVTSSADGDNLGCNIKLRVTK